MSGKPKVSRFSLMWLVILFVPLIEIGYHWKVQLQVPSRDDWRQAAAVIEKQHQEGDLVVITPWWATEGWVHLGRFMTIERMAREDDRGWGRIWEVAWKARGREDLEQTGKLLSEQKAGRLKVRLWSFPDAPDNIYDFVSAIENGSVAMTDHSGNNPKPCKFKKHAKHMKSGASAVQTGKFMCNPARSWNHVAREVIADLENKPRLCIWAHPVSNERIRIRFDDVPGGAFIEGHTGLKYEADRETANKPPVFIDIFASDALVGSAMHEEGGGWTHYKFPVPSDWQGGSVSFEVHSPSDGMQHFCFTGKLRDK